MLADLIDSSFIDNDQVLAVMYLYIAHFEAGMEKTYLADLARVLTTAGCFELPDSLFKLHLELNPEDDLALRDYSLLLAQFGEFDRARKLLKFRIKEAKKKSRTQLTESLGMVSLMEFLQTDEEDALDDAFDFFREARFGKERLETRSKTGRLTLDVDYIPTQEPGKYRFTFRIKHDAGSDAIIVGIRGWIAFGREIENEFINESIQDMHKLFGSVYIGHGDSLQSERGAFEISGDLGGFAPFYEGEGRFAIIALFPDGRKRYVRHNLGEPISSGLSLSRVADALSYGETDWAESVLTDLATSGEMLPPRWRASVELSRIMENPLLWESGLRVVDSLLIEKHDPNLSVFKGALLYLLGRKEEAAYPLKQAVEADSTNFWAWYNLALVEYDLGNKKQAAALFLKTAEVNNRMFVANLLAGVIYEELGYLNLALEQYEYAFHNVAFRAIEVDRWIKDLKAKLNEESAE